MENIPSPQSFIFSDDYICQWDSCLKNFDDAELLYEHVRDDHVGRKAHHNLCLTCHWDKCTVPTFAKRDHITSHLRVHIASKPFACEICRKGFKRPQDLKKHEKTHQDNSTSGVINSSSHLQPGGHEQGYQPLTPPSYLDRSPSIASSTISNSHSPYNMPMSPASMIDSTDSWNNPGLASPSQSTNSDIYNSPSVSDLDVDLTHNQAFNRPHIDVSGAYYGAFPPASSNFEDMISPLSAKRSREGYDEILSDTLGSFATEAKKRRSEPAYNEDMMGRLNALQTILESNPLTPDRLISSLPINDWNQFNQLNQFCSTLFEDVSGEVYESQNFGTLFPDFEQKQNPLTMNSNFGVNGFQNYNAAAINTNLGNNNNNNNNLNFSTASQGESIYSTVLPDDPYVNAPTAAPMAYGTEQMPWDITSGAPIQMPGVRSAPARNTVQQPINPYDHRFVALNNVMSGRVKPEVKVEVKQEVFEPKPKVVVKVERTYADMSTQTKAKQEKHTAEGGVMMMQRPVEKKKSKSSYEGMDPDLLMLSAPSVPDTPLPELETDEIAKEDQEDGQEKTTNTVEQADVAQTSGTQPASSSRFGGYVQKARAKQAAAAAAAASTTTEPLDPLDAMTQQLAQTHLAGAPIKVASTTPNTEGEVQRQIKAANARALCAQDPVRQQHAKVVLDLLKSIDALMADHRQKVAAWKESQIRQQQANGSVPRASTGAPSNIYPRAGGVNVQSQGQIRTVSSYLPHRAPHQASPLHQEHSNTDIGYSQLRSSLTEERPLSYSSQSSDTSSDSPALYPTSDLHNLDVSEAEPFELSEEERRFIEEDYAKTAATEALTESAYPTVHV
ncbi:hypothetical protein BGZ46_009722 [Entomortierella lignicola]|nr:hypothetical protein BGZ46_009722 [Entomortierella lignicola]